MYCNTIWDNARNELLDELLKLQKRSGRLTLHEKITTPSNLLFRKLKWIPIHNLVEIKKNQMIFNVLLSSTPTEVRKLFTFVHEAHNKYTHSSLIDLSLHSVGSGSAKSKLSYSSALLFSSLPSNLNLIYNYTNSTYITKLKTFFRNLNF